MTYRLTFNNAVDIWLRHWAGEYQHTIAASYDVNQGRVNDVLNERLHIGSKAVSPDRHRHTATGIAGCCARAASGHAAAALPSSVMNPAAFQIDRIAPDPRWPGPGYPRWPGPGCRISNLARISQEAAERFLAC